MPHRTSSALRCFVTTVVVAALALGTAGPVSAADAADETGTLTGRVLGEGDGGPDADIDSVYVDLIDPDRPGYDTGYFDESTDGTFTIAGVEPGDYQVKYTPNDSVHLARWLGGTREPSATVAVVADERTATPLQVLPLGGTISGVVTYGGPDAPSPTSITVNAGWYAYYWGGEATPDEDGRYTIRGLELQDYHVSFEGIPAYVPEYWNGAPDQRTAQVTTVTETGQAIFGRDAVLEKGGSLSGRVTAADTGQGLNQVPVTAHRVADVADPEHYPEGYDGFALVTTDAEGHYEMEGLRAGTWRIEADAREVTLRNQLDVLPIDQWYGGTADESKARGVAVSTGGARSGIDIAMPSVPALHGLVATREFLESYTDVTVTAEQVCSDAPCLTRSVEVDSAVGNEYAFTDLPAGQYRIRYDTATDPDEGAEAARYLSGYWIGDRTRQDATVVDYPAGGTVTANIMLTEEDAPGSSRTSSPGAPSGARSPGWRARTSPRDTWRPTAARPTTPSRTCRGRRWRRSCTATTGTASGRRSSYPRRRRPSATCR